MYLIEKMHELEREGKKIITIVIDEQDYEGIKPTGYGTLFKRNDHQKQIIAHSARLGIPVLLIYSDKVPMNKYLLDTLPLHLQKFVYKPCQCAFSSYEFSKYFSDKQYDYAIVAGQHKNECVRDTIFGYGAEAAEASPLANEVEKTMTKGLNEGLVGLGIKILSSENILGDSQDGKEDLKWEESEGRITLFPHV
jgi:hypothetical protein